MREITGSSDGEQQGEMCPAFSWATALGIYAGFLAFIAAGAAAARWMGWPGLG